MVVNYYFSKKIIIYYSNEKMKVPRYRLRTMIIMVTGRVFVYGDNTYVNISQRNFS